MGLKIGQYSLVNQMMKNFLIVLSLLVVNSAYSQPSRKKVPAEWIRQERDTMEIFVMESDSTHKFYLKGNQYLEIISIPDLHFNSFSWGTINRSEDGKKISLVKSLCLRANEFWLKDWDTYFATGHCSAINTGNLEFEYVNSHWYANPVIDTYFTFSYLNQLLFIDNSMVKTKETSAEVENKKDRLKKVKFGGRVKKIREVNDSKYITVFGGLMNLVIHIPKENDLRVGDLLTVDQLNQLLLEMLGNAIIEFNQPVNFKG